MNNMYGLGRGTMLIGVILTLMLLLVSANSTYYFLGVLKVKAIEWITFNACVPSNLAYMIGFAIFIISGNKSALGIGILPMLFFGGMGLFIFPWGGTGIIVQISHIIMTLNVLWAVYATFSSSDFKALAVGLLVGIILYVPFIAFQQHYAGLHQEDLKRVLQLK